MTKDSAEFLISLPQKVRDLLKKGSSRDDILMNVSRLLHDEVPAYDWVGFYLTDPEEERELILGPYIGKPTEHTRIPFGSGICGQSAETLQTFLVEDVNKESNYLACSPTVKSEIVIPILNNGKFVGELDIDSDRLAGIGSEDQRILEEICKDLASLF